MTEFLSHHMIPIHVRNRPLSLLLLLPVFIYIFVFTLRMALIWADIL
jgi:hypothetical protein